MPIGLEHYIILASLLFCIGLFGALSKRNAVMILMSLELMFNGVNIAMVAFSRYVVPALLTGHVFALFIIVVAAAEVALALGIIVALYRSRESVDVEETASMRG